MKTVNLTDYECKLIIKALNPYKICNSSCYENYKKVNCSDKDIDGKTICKMRRAINNIEEKLEANDND